MKKQIESLDKFIVDGVIAEDCNYLNKVVEVKNLKKVLHDLKEEIIDVNKHLDLHNVDECECCEKNWKCVNEILQLIKDRFGELV
jgi:hypothetical protein